MVTTEALVASSITNVRVTSVKSTEISLAWDAPSTNDGSESENDLVETYEVIFYLEFMYSLVVIEYGVHLN